VNQRTPLASAISLVIAAAATGAGGIAWAQEAETVAQAAALEEIVVTGSRIRRDTYSAAEPMDVVAPSQAVVQGIGSVSALLQSASVAAGSPQVTSATSTAFVQAGGIGAQTLSLRGLGANRTLVLLNGRRAGPAGTRGQVSSFDFNVLPLTTIERIEILKDGASSIYGSDAVAGVVNVITKKSAGLDIDAHFSQPQEGGGEEARFSMSWGVDGERGRFRVTGDYFKERELTQGDRSWFECAEQYIFSPETGQRRDVIDPRTNRPACRDLLWGHVWLYDYQRFFTDNGGQGNVPTRTGTLAQYDYDRNLGNYIPGIAVDPTKPYYLTTPPNWFLVNYNRQTDSVANADHPFQDASSLNPEVERVTFFADGEFDITDNTSAYAEVLLNRRTTKANGYRQFWTYIYSSDFDFFDFEPGVGGSPLSEGWGGALWLSPTPITDHSDDKIQVEYMRFATGLRGKFGQGWSWELNGQYSKSDGDYISDQIFNDSIEDNWFNFGSCVGSVSSVRGAPCVDVPWLDPQFLAGDVSPQVREFLFGREKGNTEYTQWTAEAFVTGALFDLPAGPLSIAAGLFYQNDEIRDVPGEITLAGNGWGTSSAGITAGDDKTKAAFAEIEIPLVRGKPFMESLTLTASGRYTDVDSYGSGDTYKVGLNWALNDSWRIRASQGTSFRTPALFELYLADQTSFLSQRSIDPGINWGAALANNQISQRVADNCAADGVAANHTTSISATVITGGGLGVLEAETSTSRTVGIVWRPQFAELSVSVDYFDIEVRDEVDQLGARQVVFGCYNSLFFGSDPLCDLFERRQLDNGIDNVRDSFINIATQTNKGFDLSVLYRTGSPLGTLTFETQHTYQTEDKRGLFADTIEDSNGLVGDPEWVGRFNTTLERGPWSFFWGMNFIGSTSNEKRFGGNTATYRGEEVRVVLKTDTVVYHSLSASRQFEKGLTARFGVANVANQPPPRLTTLNLGEVSTVGNSAFYSQYDWLGRRFFLNVSKTF
jgi:iron complex outermembrane recepter protein